ncbi:MAG TPA: 30S ribosomal protein S17 [Patescibacteria group bacterium]|nr:30S ribosomal protein S17 [Patescibacteria group bacterium]
MAKILSGTVVSTGMYNTVVVLVEWKKPHPLYRKLLKRSKKFKAETHGKEYKIGQKLQIVETKPVAKDKHFEVVDSKDKENKKV